MLTLVITAMKVVKVDFKKTAKHLLILVTLLAGAIAKADIVNPAYGDQNLTDLNTFKECDSCPEMIVLPLGRFLFGTSEIAAEEAHQRMKSIARSDKIKDSFPYGNFVNELPEHEVVIDIPIAMGRNEVTREEWAACVADEVCSDRSDERIHFRHPNGPYQDHPRSPIAAITYLEAEEYVAWLNKKIGMSAYRLPTEAEWEYAALAGANTPFAQGNTLTRKQANFAVFWLDLEDGEIVWESDPENEKRPVSADELDAANDWGLRHMSGNLSEMTRSCWNDKHIGLVSSSRYLATSTRPLGCKRVDKGGFFAGHVELSRPARRTSLSEDHWSPWIGFRVVREMNAPIRQSK